MDVAPGPAACYPVSYIIFAVHCSPQMRGGGGRGEGKEDSRALGVGAKWWL